jgi:hypothetical protein
MAIEDIYHFQQPATNARREVLTETPANRCLPALGKAYPEVTSVWINYLWVIIIPGGVGDG